MWRENYVYEHLKQTDDRFCEVDLYLAAKRDPDPLFIWIAEWQHNVGYKAEAVFSDELLLCKQNINLWKANISDTVSWYANLLVLTKVGIGLGNNMTGVKAAWSAQGGNCFRRQTITTQVSKPVIYEYLAMKKNRLLWYAWSKQILGDKMKVRV